MNPGLPVRTDATVPLVDLVAQRADVNAEVTKWLAEVFRQAAFIGGLAEAGFATAYAEFLSVCQRLLNPAALPWGGRVSTP